MSRTTGTYTLSSSRFNTSFILLSLGILLLSFWLRATNLYIWPIFGDEGIHIAWVQRFTNNISAYPYLMDGRPLLILVGSLFSLAGPQPLWVGRAFVATCSLLACASCIEIGRRLGGTQIGLLSGAIYAILPLAVFYDRQFMADPFMAYFGAVILVTAFRLTKRNNLISSVIFGFMLYMTVWAKVSGLVYAIFPALALWLFPSNSGQRRQALLGSVIGGTLAILLTVLTFMVLGSRLGENAGWLPDRGSCFLSISCLTQNGSVERLLTVNDKLVEIVSQYIGWPLLLASVTGFLVACYSKRKALVCLGLFAFAAIGTFGVITVYHTSFPRHILPLVVPLSVLAVTGLMAVLDQVQQRLLHRYHIALRLIALGLLLVMIYPELANTARIITAPELAALPASDDVQYRMGYYSGGGYDLAAQALVKREANHLNNDVVIVTNVEPYFVTAYLGTSTIQIRIAPFYPDCPIKFDNIIYDSANYQKAYLTDITHWLAEGNHVYVIDQVILKETMGAALESPYTPPDPVLGLTIDEIGIYPRRGDTHQVRLRQILSVPADTEEAIPKTCF